VGTGLHVCTQPRKQRSRPIYLYKGTVAADEGKLTETRLSFKRALHVSIESMVCRQEDHKVATDSRERLNEKAAGTRRSRTFWEVGGSLPEVTIAGGRNVDRGGTLRSEGG